VLQEIDSEIEEAIVQALAHKARRNILRIVRSSENGVSYTELLNELGLPTGKLNYHLRQLEGLIEKTGERKYVLTSFGGKALSLLDSIMQESKLYEPYVKIARLAQRSSLHPLMRWLLYIGIAAISLMLVGAGLVMYVAITEGAPLVFLFMSIASFLIGVAILGWLIYALKTVPEYVREFEKKVLKSE